MQKQTLPAFDWPDCWDTKPRAITTPQQPEPMRRATVHSFYHRAQEQISKDHLATWNRLNYVRKPT